MANIVKPFSPDNNTEVKRLESALAAASVGTWELDLTANEFRLCERFKNIFGFQFDDVIPIESLTNQVFLGDREYVRGTLELAVASRIPVDFEFRVSKNGDTGYSWMNFKGQGMEDRETGTYRLSGIIMDMTRFVNAARNAENARIALVQREKELSNMVGRFRSLIEQAPVAICLFTGKDMIVELANQPMVTYWGKDMSVIGKPLREAMPELDGQPFHDLLANILITKEAHVAKDARVDIEVDGVLGTYYFDFTYKPLLDENGEVYTIINISIDVTQRVLAERALEESQTQLLSLFEQSPVAIAIIKPEDLTFTMANPFYANLVGRTVDDLVGKPLRVALPELSSQGFDLLLENVLATGIPYVSLEQPVHLIRNGQPETIYIDLTYQPKIETDQRVTGIFVVATDVTAQVMSRKKTQDAENTFRGAVELAELGTWELDIHTGDMEISGRLRHWLGFEQDEPVTLEKLYGSIQDEDFRRIKNSFDSIRQENTSRVYDMEFTVKASAAARERILHTQGLPLFDDNNTLYKVIGSVQDVTVRKKMLLALEQQVQLRTEELESSNEELAAINEEYMTLNEDLSQSNEMLSRSNENLQQFAYIASHDLQEPLRKIQSLGDLLKSRFSADLGPGSEYIDRMQSSAKRMSSLIADLLSYSRVTSNTDIGEMVALDEVVAATQVDLEYFIQRSKAELHIGPLPVVRGDKLQLGQLFQNLISNGIKFQDAGVTPRVSITATTIPFTNLPSNVRPARQSDVYHKIDVADNGIGFDEKYTDRIFQIFQRLQGRSEYAGTGIGLAICQKVVVNHGGAITANSAVGKGSTFHIFLPAD